MVINAVSIANVVTVFQDCKWYEEDTTYSLKTSASSRSQHTLFTLCYSDQTIIITRSHSSILPTCFTSSLEPTSYITRNSSFELLIWTCCFNLLHTAITFDHFFTVSL